MKEHQGQKLGEQQYFQSWTKEKKVSNTRAREIPRQAMENGVCQNPREDRASRTEWSEMVNATEKWDKNWTLLEGVETRKPLAAQFESSFSTVLRADAKLPEVEMRMGGGETESLSVDCFKKFKFRSSLVA